MLKFSILGIPVGVDWWFWLMCILLGGGFYAKAPEDWHRVAVWTAVVFVSIMVHELGHALAARRFGVKPLIKLHGF
jgi:stage IV sporulation protein FB